MASPTVVARPISFVTPLIQAILAGRKTQTRRLISPQPDCFGIDDDGQPVAYSAGKMLRCKFGRAGDHLWAQERWTDRPDDPASFDPSNPGVIYAADLKCPLPGRWKPARFMPRRHSRITLQIDAVRIVRLTQISTDDARAEGFDPAVAGSDPRAWFRQVWDGLSDESTNWVTDPLVWVVQFQVLSRKVRSAGI